MGISASTATSTSVSTTITTGTLFLSECLCKLQLTRSQADFVEIVSFHRRADVDEQACNFAAEPHIDTVNLPSESSPRSVCRAWCHSCWRIETFWDWSGRPVAISPISGSPVSNTFFLSFCQSACSSNAPRSDAMSSVLQKANN